MGNSIKKYQKIMFLEEKTGELRYGFKKIIVFLFYFVSELKMK